MSHSFSVLFFLNVLNDRILSAANKRVKSIEVVGDGWRDLELSAPKVKQLSRFVTGSSVFESGYQMSGPVTQHDDDRL